jgi:hypothetical protein
MRRMRERVSEGARNRAVARLQRGYASEALGTGTFERCLDAALSTDSPRVLRQTLSEVRPLSLLERVRSWIPRPAMSPSSGLLMGLAGRRPTILGRSRACDLVLADDSVSRRHAMVLRDGERFVVTDLGSTNGTYLNGRRITQAEAHPGDRLQLGELDLVL